MPLKRVLGPIQLIFYSVGVIVGAGVYSVIGSAAGLAQGGLWLSFLIGAAVALLTAFSYAEVATSFPIAGAEYAYIRQAWPGADWLSFTVAMVILLGGAATAATVAMAFAGYLRVFIDVPPTLAGLFLLLLCCAVNIWGLQESSWLNVVFTSVEIAGLLLVVVAGTMSETPPQLTPPTQEPAVMAAAALLFFVYLGFEEVANLAEEATQPARDLPLALFVSIAVTTALYVMVAVAVASLASSSELAASEAPLATAIENVWPRAGNVLSAIALFATANTVLITLIASSRLAFSLARDGEIPSVFARVLKNRQTPWSAALLCLAMAAALLPAGSVKVLAELSSFSALLAFISVNAVLIALRYQRPEHPRPFRVPLAIGRFPIIPAAAMASIAILLVHFDWQIYVAGAIGLAVSGLVFLGRAAVRRRNR
jgi:basic amino acid/polyamine antiporter, APA family